MFDDINQRLFYQAILMFCFVCSDRSLYLFVQALTKDKVDRKLMTFTYSVPSPVHKPVGLYFIQIKRNVCFSSGSLTKLHQFIKIYYVQNQNSGCLFFASWVQLVVNQALELMVIALKI